jgi:hypothetical protein
MEMRTRIRGSAKERERDASTATNVLTAVLSARHVHSTTSRYYWMLVVPVNGIGGACPLSLGGAAAKRPFTGHMYLLSATTRIAAIVHYTRTGNAKKRRAPMARSRVLVPKPRPMEAVQRIF